MTDALRRALALGLPERTVDTIETQNTRPDNETAHVTFADAAPVYVKTATDENTRLAREIAATRYAGEHCPVGAPTVVAADATADPPYLATEPLPGTLFNDRWTDGDDREVLLSRLGHVIAGVHEATFDRPGVITGGDETGLELTAETWTEALCATVEWRGSDWFPDRFSDMPGRLVDVIREVDPALADKTPTLLHGDPSRINLHLDPDGLLDWERALVGDPAYGVVEALFHHLDQPDVDDSEEDALRAAFFDGYRERAGTLPANLDVYRPLYEAISYLLVPQAFDDWASRADAPNDELAADVNEEFDSRLAAARDELL